ncbi:MAG: AMP-binding protein [Chloroflexi bacterium]|nr:AMP-binding protein [Chloroflexota bacterium]
MTTLASVLQPATRGARAVVIPEGPSVTYEDLGSQVERVAEHLAALGIERGRPMSIVLGNNLEYLVTFLGVARVGAIAAPLNPGYTVDEFKFFMSDANAQLAIIAPGAAAAAEAAQALGIKIVTATVDGRGQVALQRDGTALSARRDVAAPAPGDVALFLHTSGTTSRPKGVPLTHANLMASLRNIKGTYALTPRDVSLIVMPLFHVHGLLGATLSTLNSGGTVVVPPRFSASRFWPVQQEMGATWFSAVPTIHQTLLLRADTDGARRESFRFIRSCSSALVPAVFERLEARFGAPVLEAYGMTEASHQMSSNPLPPGERSPGTVGPGTGVQIGIMDEKGKLLPGGERGEVVISGPNVTKGYSNNPKANAESFVNGWFRTGDQGYLDKRSYLTLTGRIKELINRGGEKISPLEVDAVLLGHPAVAEAVCFACPDVKYGEVVHAAVVLRSEADPAAIQAFCREHLASFKVPEKIYVTTQLPRTATGKIQRRHVAAAFKQQI